MSTTGENAPVGIAVRASNAAGDDDWRWMVAEDPAFYLDNEPVTAGTVAGEGG